MKTWKTSSQKFRKQQPHSAKKPRITLRSPPQERQPAGRCILARTRPSGQAAAPGLATAAAPQRPCPAPGPAAHARARAGGWRCACAPAAAASTPSPAARLRRHTKALTRSGQAGARRRRVRERGRAGADGCGSKETFSVALAERDGLGSEICVAHQLTVT